MGPGELSAQESGDNLSPSVIEVHNPTGTEAKLWGVAQVAGLLLTAILLAGLVALPETTLNLLWNVTIPVLPAVFLVSPLLWRNVCPLATLNKVTGDRIGKRQLSPGAATVAGGIGILLLFLLVPARRFLFNTDGFALLVTIVAVALLAILAGTLYSAKAGFCNSICPVLPVERLYGQRPLASVPNARCFPCTVCTGRGCVDLSPTKSIAQTLGSARRTPRWILTPFGAFAASFPGFVLGYFTTADGPLSTAPGVYLHIFLWTAASFLVVGLASLVRPGRNQELVLLTGGGALAFYYWFASPNIVEALTLPPSAAVPLRLVALSLVLFWLKRAWSVAERSPPDLLNHRT